MLVSLVQVAGLVQGQGIAEEVSGPECSGASCHLNHNLKAASDTFVSSA